MYFQKVKSKDPDPQLIDTDPRIQIRTNSPKCHGSTTLLVSLHKSAALKIRNYRDGLSCIHLRFTLL
jgi:hypothetical protein